MSTMYLLIVLAFISLSMAQHSPNVTSSPTNSLNTPSTYTQPWQNNYTVGNGTSGNYTAGNGTSGNVTGVHNQTETPYRYLMAHIDVQRWCDQFVLPGTKPSAIPANADSNFMTSYMAQFIIPERQSTWYTWCYLPYHGLLTADSWYNGGIAAANRAFSGAMRTAASGIATFQDVLGQSHSQTQSDVQPGGYFEDAQGQTQNVVHPGGPY